MTTEETLLKSTGANGTIRQISILGHTVNYVECGAGEPLILIHGGTFGWGWWYKNITELGKRFRVYAIDVPGSGYSSGSDLPDHDFIGRYVRPIADFIRERDLSSAPIVAHSFGGWIALKLVQIQGIQSKKLLLVDPTGFADHANMSDLMVSFRPFANFLANTALNPKKGNQVMVKFLHTAFAKENVPLSQDFLDYLSDIMQRSHAILFISKLISNRKLLRIDESELSGIHQETLVLWGEKDLQIPLKYSQPSIRHIPHSTLRVLSGVGHVPQLEVPEQFNAISLEFLI